MLLHTLTVLHFPWSPLWRYIWWNTRHESHCLLFLVVRSWMNLCRTEELLSEDLVIVMCEAATGAHVGRKTAGSSESSCPISCKNFFSFLRHFKEEDDGEGGRSPSERWEVFNHSDAIHFSLLFTSNQHNFFDFLNFVHYFSFVCVFRHTSNICHISFFLLLAWPLSRPFSLSVGLNHPLTSLRLWCNVSGPGLLLLASAAGSAPNAIVRLILSLSVFPPFTLNTAAPLFLVILFCLFFTPPQFNSCLCFRLSAGLCCSATFRLKLFIWLEAVTGAVRVGNQQHSHGRVL